MIRTALSAPIRAGCERFARAALAANVSDSIREATVNSPSSSRPFLRLFSAFCGPEADQTAEGPGRSRTQDTAVAASTDPSDNAATATHSAARPMIAGSIHAGPPTHCEPQDDNHMPATVNPKRVEVSLAEIAPVLADAINHRRGWLSDFSDDTVSIDADLYEVLLAYQQMRRLNAA